MADSSAYEESFRRSPQPAITISATALPTGVSPNAPSARAPSPYSSGYPSPVVKASSIRERDTPLPRQKQTPSVAPIPAVGILSALDPKFNKHAKANADTEHPAPSEGSFKEEKKEKKVLGNWGLRDKGKEKARDKGDREREKDRDKERAWERDRIDDGPELTRMIGTCHFFYAVRTKHARTLLSFITISSVNEN